MILFENYVNAITVLCDETVNMSGGDYKASAKKESELIKLIPSLR